MVLYQSSFSGSAGCTLVVDVTIRGVWVKSASKLCALFLLFLGSLEVVEIFKKIFFFFCRDIWQQTGCLFWIVFLRTSILLPGHSTCSSVVFLYDLGHVTIFSGPPFPRLYKGMTIFYLCPSSRLAQVVHGGTSLYLGTYVVLFNLR